MILAEMSRENAELVLAMYERFNARDLDGALALIDEEIEVESRLVAMEGGYHGHEGLRRWWSDLLDFIPDYRGEVEEVHDLGEVALAHACGLGHGAASATPVVDWFWQPLRFRDGKCIWWRNCALEEEALESIGWR